MRAAGVGRIAFSSTGSVYGEPSVFPTPEDAPFPVQTSLYAASKLAGEGMIGRLRARLRLHRADLPLRLDPRRALHARPRVRLLPRAQAGSRPGYGVLGDGRQTKSYLYVGDCVEAMLLAAARHEQLPGEVGVYNLGTDEVIEVDDSIRVICEHMGVDPEIEHTGGARGWPGDSPLIHLDCARIRALGWAPRLSIREAILSTLRWFDANPYAWEDPVQVGPS